jgi:hypothetical protein
VLVGGRTVENKIEDETKEFRNIAVQCSPVLCSEVQRSDYSALQRRVP